MTLRTRRIIFYGLILVFIPLSFGIIFYSQGWRFDAENFSIAKTGAIYIETAPKNVVIKLNNKIIPDESGLIKSGTFISDLLPKNYQLEIQKNGYLTYRKNLKVEPSMVSELINTILIPQKFESKKIIDNKLKGGEIADISAKKIIIKNQTNNYYLYDTDDSASVFNINASFNNLRKTPETIQRLIFHPFDADKFIIETTKGLYIFDKSRLKLETTAIAGKNEKIIAWTVKNPNIYLIKIQDSRLKIQDYIISSYNLVAKVETSLAQLPINANIVELKISNSGRKIGILDKLGDLLIFDIQTKDIKQIAHNAKNFAFSPDNKKIAFLDNDEKLNIYFIEDWYKNIRKKSGDVISFNLKNKELIENIHWYKDSFHLFIKHANENETVSLDFMEIDNRPPLNLSPIINNFESAYYDTNSNFLYFIQNKILYTVEI